MQFTVLNNCPFPICAFTSDVRYTTDDLAKMLKPSEVLKKAIYDYYWYNHADSEVASHLHNNATPYMKYLGCSSDSIEVYNMNRVSQFLYIFFTKIVHKKITLWYYEIPIKRYFNKYDTMAVYQFTVRINCREGDVTVTSDANTGALLIDYFGDAEQIESQSVEWVPSMQLQTTDHSWKFAFLVFVFIVILIVGIIFVFAITIRQPKSTTKYVTNKVENIETKAPEYLS